MMYFGTFGWLEEIQMKIVFPLAEPQNGIQRQGIEILMINTHCFDQKSLFICDKYVKKIQSLNQKLSILIN
jgi:hypothetical protein